MGYDPNIRFVADGEEVKAGVANRAAIALAQNVEWLRAALEIALRSDTVIAMDKTLNSEVKVGQPVYFDTDTQQYEQAIANTSVDPLTGGLVTAMSSQVWGIVLEKTNATKGNILLHGVAEVDMTQAIVGTPELGKLYFLSGMQAGKLTSSRPPVGIPVLIVANEGVTTGEYSVYVNSQFTDFLSAHTHTKYDLVAEPSGDHATPGAGNPHTISNADSTKEGWLPADDAIFSGNAPSGAKFGYNISASALADVWPPVPVLQSSVEIYRESVGDTLPTLPTYGRVPQQVCVVDSNGIWWMTDCYDSVPWPTNLDTSDPVSVSSVPGSCPVLDAIDDVLLTLWYTNINFLTSAAAVLSLVGRDGSGLTFYCRNTNDEASVGHLEADLDLNLLVESTTEPGYIAFKTYDSETRKFRRGPVVESVRSLSPELVVTGDVVGNDGKVYGNLLIQADLDLAGANYAVETVRLDGVEEEYYQDVIGLGFPTGRASEFRGRILIPTRLTLPSGTKMKLRFAVLGRSAGVTDADTFTLTYRRLSRPSAVQTALVALPTADSALTMACAITFANADEYAELESGEFEVATGDTVLFSISRAASDGYADRLILLRKEGILVAGGS